MEHTFTIENEIKLESIEHENTKELFSCTVCDKKYLHKSSLKIHMRNHTRENLFKCSECGTQYLHKISLLRHIKLHTEPDLQEMTTTSSSNSTKTFQNDLTDFLFPYQSKVICDKIKSEKVDAVTTAVIQNDVAITDEISARNFNAITKTYDCQLCDKKYNHRYNLTFHLKLHKENIYQCFKCLKMFTSNYVYQKHTRNHATGKLKICRKPPNFNKITNTYDCKLCDMKFQHGFSLTLHMENHLFKCSKCCKSFTHDFALKRHKKLHKTRKVEKDVDINTNILKTYDCELCDKKYLSPFSLKLHMKYHTGKDLYQCYECLKSFSDFASLKRHMTTHTTAKYKRKTLKIGIKTYDCTICNKKYMTETTLKLHMKFHTGKNLYQCSECSRNFNVEASLRRHMKSHAHQKLKARQRLLYYNKVTNTFDCNQCDKKFPVRVSLISHFKVHGGHMSIPCTECPEISKNKKSFKTHMEMHEKQKLHNNSASSSNNATMDVEDDSINETQIKCEDISAEKNETVQMVIAETATLQNNENNSATSSNNATMDVEDDSINETQIKCEDISAEKNETVQMAIAETAILRQYLNNMNNSATSSNNATMDVGDDSINETQIKCEDISPEKNETVPMVIADTATLQNNEESNSLLHYNSLTKTFDCNLCDKKFSLRASLISHYKVHGGAVSIPCTECPKILRSKETFEKHMAIHKKKKLQASKKMLNYNKVTNTFDCNLCDKKFSVRLSLISHYKVHGGAMSIPCTECPEILRSKETLEKHMEIHGKNKLQASNKMFNSNIITLYNKATNTFDCNLCDKNFFTRASLIAHFHVHKELQTNSAASSNYATGDVEGGLINENQIKYEVISAEKNETGQKDTVETTTLKNNEEPLYRVIHECKKCHHKFKYLHAFKSHMKLHAGNFLECSYCFKTFNRRALLRNHMRIHVKHEKSREVSGFNKTTNTFDCQQCHKKYKTRVLLKIHQRLHTGKNLHRCSKCFKIFTEASQLNRHLKTHTTTTVMNESSDAKPKENGIKLEKKKNDTMQKIIIKNIKLEKDEEITTTSSANTIKTFQNDLTNVLSSNQSEIKYHEIKSENIDEATTAVIQTDVMDEIGLPTYDCEICGKKYLAKSNLTLHMKFHTGENLFQCSECSKNFNVEAYLQRHMKTHAPPKKTHAHPMKTHQQLKRGNGTYDCTICDKKYQRKQSLALHMKYHTGENLYQCSECSKKFYAPSHLKKHMESHAREKLKARQRLLFYNRVTNTFDCNLCNGKYSTRVLLNMHLKTHMPCTDGSESLSSKVSFKKHMQIHEKQKLQATKILRYYNRVTNTFDCNQCDKKFNIRASLRSHLGKVHGRHMRIPCTDCSEILWSKKGFTVHMKIHEKQKLQEMITTSSANTIKTFQNDLTKVLSSNQSGINYDKIKSEKVDAATTAVIQTDVTDEVELPTYDCAICGKKYLSQTTLKLHMKFHTGENLYQCPECSKNFNMKASLIRHIKTHAHQPSKTGRETYDCAICGKKYLEKCSLRLHMNFHTGENLYQCSECSRNFSAEASLLRHMKSHAHQKLKARERLLYYNKETNTFDCNQCGKKCTRRVLLTRHLKSHIQCKDCSEVLSSTINFKKHMQIHEKQKLQNQSVNIFKTEEEDGQSEFIDNTKISYDNIKTEKTHTMSTSDESPIKIELAVEEMPTNPLFGDVICKEEVILPNESV